MPCSCQNYSNITKITVKCDYLIQERSTYTPYICLKCEKNVTIKTEKSRFHIMWHKGESGMYIMDGNEMHGSTELLRGRHYFTPTSCLSLSLFCGLISVSWGDCCLVRSLSLICMNPWMLKVLLWPLEMNDFGPGFIPLNQQVVYTYRFVPV